MIILLYRDEYEQITKFEKETMSDYKLKVIKEDEFERYYIEQNNLLALVSDLIVEYNRKVEELSDMQYQLDNYYTKKREEFE